jgi:hypothetical protein
MYLIFSSTGISFLAGGQLVAGHGAIVKAVGDQGGTGMALGHDHLTECITLLWLTLEHELTHPHLVMAPPETPSSKTPLASWTLQPLLLVRLLQEVPMTQQKFSQMLAANGGQVSQI